MTVDHPPFWFVVSVSFDSLGARSRRDVRSPLLLRGYGDSSTALENKIIDRFFEVVISAASVGRFNTVAHLVKNLLWSLTLATRVCLTHGNSIFVVDKYPILTNAPRSQPLACAGRFRKEVFVSVCVERSGTLLCLCAEPPRTRTGPTHRQSGLDCLGTFRGGERLQSVNEVEEDSETKSNGRLRNPNAAVAANPGLRLHGVRIREVMEELVYDPEFHTPLLAALNTLGSAKGLGLPVQAVKVPNCNKKRRTQTCALNSQRLVAHVPSSFHFSHHISTPLVSQPVRGERKDYLAVPQRLLWQTRPHASPGTASPGPCDNLTPPSQAPNPSKRERERDLVTRPIQPDDVQRFVAHIVLSRIT